MSSPTAIEKKAMAEASKKNKKGKAALEKAAVLAGRDHHVQAEGVNRLLANQFRKILKSQLTIEKNGKSFIQEITDLYNENARFDNTLVKALVEKYLGSAAGPPCTKVLDEAEPPPLLSYFPKS